MPKIVDDEILESVQPYKLDYITELFRNWHIEVFAEPFDTIKIRMQLQGERANVLDRLLVNTPYRGMIATGLKLVKEEGFFKLWVGLTSRFLAQCTIDTARLIGCTEIGPLLFEIDATDDALNTWQNVFCVGLNIALALWLDTDVIAYELIKEEYIKREGEAMSMGSRLALNLFLGLSFSIIGCPIDVVRTRIMNQRTDDYGRGLIYKNSWDCLKKTVFYEGFAGLFKGFLPFFIRVGPRTAICFFMNDYFDGLFE